MPFLPGLAVVFAGITGTHDHRVEAQVKAIAAELHCVTTKISAADLAVIGHHGSGARAVVRKLHVDGVIAGEYVVTGGHATIRVITYGADGGMRSLSEIPLSERVLGADDLDTLRSNLEDEVTAMGGSKPGKADRSEVAFEVDPPAKAAKAAPVVEAKHKAAPQTAAATIADDDDMPSNLGGSQKIASKTKAPPAETHKRREPKAEPKADAEPSADPSTGDDATPAASDSDAVSVAELEAMSAGTNDAATGVEAAASASSMSDLHLRAAVGLGLGTRSFSGPSTLPQYASSAVGVVRFAASVQPTEKITVAGIADRTLSMSTPIGSEMAPTSFSRWEIAADYALVKGGTLTVAPQLGVGSRGFSIDSANPAQSSAYDYEYAVLGVRAAAALGSKAGLHAHAAFEPVLSGTDPTAMSFGAATRWAFDVGAAVEYRAFSHVFARAAFDYQRFNWSWAQAGARGATGAVDGYPSGTLSLGAEY